MRHVQHTFSKKDDINERLVELVQDDHSKIESEILA